MSRKPVLQLAGWHLRRGDEVAIGPLDLSLWGGEIVTLMGPSGIGKTTFLMAMLGYEDPELTVFGERRQVDVPLSSGAVPRQSLYIPQQLPFNPNWEVQGYLCRLPWGNPSWLDLLWPTRPRRLRRVRDVLTRLGLGRRSRATVAELSGGEAQRAALAQMLLLEFELKLIIGDEFVSALDPGLSISILDQLREIVVRTGAAAVLALHDAHAALHVSDHILVFWPAELSRDVWRFRKDDPAWRPDCLHTVLCLSRWANDLALTPAVSELIRSLKSVFQEKGAPEGWGQQWSAGTTVLLGNDLPFVEAQVIDHVLIPAASGRVIPHEMSPVRMCRGDDVYIGFSLPRPGQAPTTVLACAGPASCG